MQAVAIRMAAGGTAARETLRVAAIAAAGLLIAASAPGVGGMAGLAWIAFAPWFAVLQRLRATTAALSGLALGLAYIVPGRWSTFAAAVGNAGGEGLSRELWTLAFFAAYALPFLLYGAIDGWLRRQAGAEALTRGALLRAAALAGLITLCWSPFPYTPVSAIVDFHGIVQWAALGGEPLLLTLLLWPSALLGAVLVRRPSRGAVARALLVLVLTLGLAHVGGEARIAAMDRAEAGGDGLRLSALTLQLDLPPNSSPGLLTRDRAQGGQSAVELTRRGYAEAPRCELAVWPEVPLDASNGVRVCAAGQALAASTGRPLLMQCHRPVGDQFQLTAEWLRPQAAPEAHAKSRLVLGYERPLFDRPLLQVGSPGAVFAGGQFIAHQVSFGGFDRQPIDHWDQPMARLTAVAYGVPILRSSNRAPIGWIDANGRVRAVSERFGRRAECQDVWSPASTPTPYTRIAPLAPVLPALTLLALIGLGRRWRRVPSNPSPTRSPS